MSHAGQILWRAIKVVQEREKMYGPPVEHWARTGRLVSVVLEAKLRPGCVVTAEDWGKIMLAEKLSRTLGPNGGVDQLIDLAGYADGIDRLNRDSDAPARDSA